MSNEELSIISNRMQTLLDLYDRESTIPSLVEKTGLTYSQIQKVLSANNYYHGIKRLQGTPDYPIKALIFYRDFEYLLRCTNLDNLRMVM